MNILLLGVVICILLTACSGKDGGEKTVSNFLDFTAKERKEIRKILDFYGGDCRYAV